MTTIYVYYLQSSDLLCQIINELTLFFKGLHYQLLLHRTLKNVIKNI